MEKINPNEENFNEKVPTTPGIYRILFTNNDKPIPINRLLKKDDSGIMYIGITENLQVRTANIKKSLPIKKSSGSDYKSNSHQFGNKAKEIEGFFERFNVSGIRIEYEELTQDTNLFEYERIIINEYIQVYGEAPPFNSF